MPRTRPPYPPEFRREAIRLVRASDEELPIPRVATDLGVSVETLRNRVKQDEIDEGEGEGLTTEEKEELRRLRREAKTLRQGGDRGSMSRFRFVDAEKARFPFRCCAR